MVRLVLYPLVRHLGAKGSNEHIIIKCYLDVIPLLKEVGTIIRKSEILNTFQSLVWYGSDVEENWTQDMKI